MNFMTAPHNCRATVYAIVTRVKQPNYGRSVPKNTCQARSDFAIRLNNM